MTHESLAVIALAGVGVLALLAGARRRARQAAEVARETARTASLAGRVLLVTGVITGGQFLVIRYVHSLAWLLLALALPALLAALTAVRATTVTPTITYGRKGGRR